MKKCNIGMVIEGNSITKYSNKHIIKDTVTLLSTVAELGFGDSVANTSLGHLTTRCNYSTLYKPNIQVSVVLLTYNDLYVLDNGNLPTRPLHDKAFLYGLCAGKDILTSENTIGDLPASLKTIANTTTTDINDCNVNNTINLGIATFVHKSNYLYIVRAPGSKNLKGKKLRYKDSYEQIDYVWVDSMMVEIWKLKDLDV